MNPEHLLQHFERLSEAPDATSRLRRFILELAVRGKLVEQDRNDEPASELLKRIQAEKTRLEKVGEIKAPKHYERRDSSEIGLPDSWAMVSLGEIVNRHLGGGTPSKNNQKYWDGSLLWASVKDVGKSKYLTTTIDRITEEGLADSSSNLIPPGNLLVVTRMGLGKISINQVPVAINQDLRALFVSSLIDIDYCYNFFLTHGFEGSGLTVKGIKIEELLSISFPLPPLAEQHRIVTKVDELMALCDQLEAAKNEREESRDRLVAASLHRLNKPAHDEEAFRKDARFTFDNLPSLTTRPAHIKQLRQTILQLAVRGKLVEQDPNDEPASELLKRISAEKARLVKEGKIGREKTPSPMSQVDQPYQLSNKWEWVRLGAITTKTGSGSTPRGGKAVYKASGIPFLRSQNVYDDGLRLNDVAYIDELTHAKMRGTALEPGDLLLNITGGSIGRCCRIPDTPIQANISQHVAIIRLAAAGMRDFIHRVVLSPFFQSFVIDEQTGAGRGGLPKNRMDQIPIPVPPQEEQHRIVAKVDELMALCDQLEDQLTITETDSCRLLEAMLHEALSPVLEAAR